jgi:hypothetical protein
MCTYRFLLVLLLTFTVTACGPQPAPTATKQPLTVPSPLPTQPTLPPLPTLTPQPTETSAPSATPTAAVGLPDIGSTAYLDDRSTPAAVMLSYFNAINRHEYLRAYSYYADFTGLPSLDEFSNGYSDTQSVAVVFGAIFSEGAAGSIYHTVPMVLNVTANNGAQQKFAACYIVRLPQPGNYGEPPITPMHIERGTAKVVAAATSDSAALASACPAGDYPVGPGSAPASVEQLGDQSSANFIDNRSDPVAVVSSLVNAVNRSEYVRAYSYWQEPAQAYDDFAAGYAGTASISAQFGTVTPDVGAGQLFFTLPAVLKTTLTGGTLQTQTACFTLHLAQPGFQGTLPFQPLGIRSVVSQPADNTADPAALLASACP